MKTREGKVLGYALLGVAAYIGVMWLFARIMKVCQSEIDDKEKK